MDNGVEQHNQLEKLDCKHLLQCRHRIQPPEYKPLHGRTNTESKNYANSDFWLEDASFVKLKNVSISYRIPRRVAKFASIQLSVSAQDLFTITRYKGMDPEVYTSYDGLDYGAYPIPRTITFGAKIRF